MIRGIGSVTHKILSILQIIPEGILKELRKLRKLLMAYRKVRSCWTHVTTQR
jgi:hypothetical protein